ncbi:MAG TPA: NAD(+) synthase, partial [Candidatus Cybelea sp.]|nr:NAD(+) synthase [Candidatus Cybelea sp.]
PTQWLTLERVARDYGNHTMRITTRQTIQLHGVIKFNVKPTLRAIDQAADELARIEPPVIGTAEAYAALTLGVRDYVRKNGFKRAVIALSGGIDSALTAAIAVDALGAEAVTGVSMPSRYSSEGSRDDARALAEHLGIRYLTLPLEDTFEAMLKTLREPFADDPPAAVALAEENLQARIRGNLLMALSNASGAIVLTTGNKSEMAVGYATLYGDMAGGFAVLKDVSKTLVYRLAAYRNALGRVIPDRVLTRAPSAELKDDQTDQDALPPYAVLDAILEAYVERDLDPRTIIADGAPPEDVQRVVQLIKRSEYKRRQAAVGIRITPRAFGKDWRYPITSVWSW